MTLTNCHQTVTAKVVTASGGECCIARYRPVVFHASTGVARRRRGLAAKPSS